MDMLGSMGQSAKGMLFDGAVDKAVIYILNPAAQPIEFEEVVKEANSLHKTLMNKAKKSLSMDDFKAGVKDMLPKKLGNDITEVSKENSKFVKFTVQYNPASIKLSTVNGKIPSRMQDGGFDSLKIYNFSGKSKLSFELVFDDVDNLNAFMLENITPNVGNISKTAINRYTHSNDGKTTFSVRKQMDAIVSLLTSVGSQQVIFYWANMCFRGTVTNVQNRFTMFNTAGNPIRGTMHLELTQDKGNTDLDYDEGYWEKAFQKCFKDARTDKGPSTGSQFMANNNLFNF